MQQFAEDVGTDYNTVRAKICNDRAKMRVIAKKREKAMKMDQV